MITEYTDCTELMRLIEEQKIKPSAIKSYLRKQGIIFTASNAESFSKDCYTIALGGQEIEYVTRMICHEGNYEKSTLVNIHMKPSTNAYRIIDYFSDGINELRSCHNINYIIEQPVRINENTLAFYIVYTKKKPGKNKLIQEETRRIKAIVRSKNDQEASIDIRQLSSSDSKMAIDVLRQIVGKGDEAVALLSHINLELLTDKNKVEFFDLLSNRSFPNWKLKTVTGLTVKKADYQANEDEIEEEILDDGVADKTLSGISQAVLDGSGLRSNEFVQNSLKQGYVITSMKYRYVFTKEAGEFIVCINSKGEDIRVDIEKTYYDEDGRLFIQPLPKDQQDEIIDLFQSAVNSIFKQLIETQKK